MQSKVTNNWRKFISVSMVNWGRTYQKIKECFLDRNFFGIEDWGYFYNINFSEKFLLRGVGLPPWNKNILNAPCPFNKGKKIKETHFCFLGLSNNNGFKFDVLGWNKFRPKSEPEIMLSGQHLSEGKLVGKTCETKWYLMPIKTPFADLSYGKQKKLLPEEYEIVTGIEEITKNILYWQKNKNLPNINRWGRCLPDGHMIVAGTTRKKIITFCWEKQKPLAILGLAVNRKF